MRTSWMLLAALAVLAAVQATELEDKILQSIEDFRIIMKNGSPEINIPKLDPVSVAKMHLPINASPFNADIVVTDLQGVGGSGFTITQLSQIDTSSKVAVSLELPSFDVTGNYAITGKVKIGFIKVNLNDQGPLAVNLRGLKGNGVANVQEHADGSLHISDIEIKEWNFDQLNINLQNILGGGVMGKTVNKLINKLVPTIIKANKEKLNKLAETKGKQYINQYLDAVAGKKTHYVSQVESGQWILSKEVQQILDELALTVVAPHVSARDANDGESTGLVDKVTELLENFKAMMKVGRPDFNIRVLDPAAVDRLPLNVKHGIFDAKIVATDNQVKGVSEFTVDNISQTDDNEVTVDLAVPEINITGTFEMRGKVEIPFAPKLNDNGPFELNIQGIKLSATVNVQENEDGSSNVKKITVNSWTYDSMHIELDNLLGGGKIGKIANAAFNKIFPELVETDRSKINGWLEVMSENLFNKYLDGLAGKVSDDLVAKIKELSETFRAAMKQGLQDINIPVMDPAVIPQLPIHVYRWPVDSQLVASKITVAGASNFQLTSVSQIIGTDKISVDFTVPTINIESDYNLASIFQLGFVKFNINEQGPLKATIEGLKVTATAEVIIDTDNFLSLHELEVDCWTYDRIQVEANSLSTGDFIKRTLNALINKLVPTLLVNPHQDDLSVWAAENGKSIISRFLDGVAGRVIIAGLDSKAANLLEDLKTVLKTGSEAYDMPVLDPASILEISMPVEKLNVKATLTGKDIKITGTSDYNINRISRIDGSNQLKVELSVAEINGNGVYDATGAAKIITDFSFHREGSLQLTIRGLRANATATMAENIAGSLSLKELQIDAWTYDEITTEFENLKNIPVIGKIVNNVINDVIPAVIKAERKTLTAWAEETSKAVLDQYLTGVAAQSESPVEKQLAAISNEARDIFNKLALLAIHTDLANAA